MASPPPWKGQARSPAPARTASRTSAFSTRPSVVGIAAAANASVEVSLRFNRIRFDRSFQHGKHLPGRDLIARRDTHFCNAAITRGLQLVLHLHGFDHDDPLVSHHRLAWRHQYARNAPRHG